MNYTNRNTHSDITQTNDVIPIKEGLVKKSPHNSDDVMLLGSKCSDCGEITIGSNQFCFNCGGNNIKPNSLSREGVLWTFTIVRHKPPGDYLGAEPFQPYGIGLVELPEGIRIMTPLEGDIDSFRIGTKLILRPWVLQSKDGQSYLAFRFKSSDRDI